MSMRTKLPAVGFMFFGLIGSPSMGQPAPVPADDIAVSIDSGVVSASGTGADPVLVYSQVVSVPGRIGCVFVFNQFCLADR